MASGEAKCLSLSEERLGEDDFARSKFASGEAGSSVASPEAKFASGEAKGASSARGKACLGRG